MVGEQPQQPEAKVTPPKAPPKPSVKNLHCINCGASVPIRCPGASLSAVCASCHSVIDLTDPQYRILTTLKVTQTKPLIELGKRGKLQGKTWEVIGYMLRRDEPSGYSWNEYLLFNPYYGYRWLVEDHGHWNLVRMTKSKADERRGMSLTATCEGTEFRLYNRGVAVVDYVVGEFYWKVKKDTKATTADFIAPPLMLSNEKDGSESVWSIAEFVPAIDIKRAFAIERLPYPVGMAPNQPAAISKLWQQLAPLWLIFSLALTGMQIFNLINSSNHEDLSWEHTFTPNEKASDITSPEFTVMKNTNLQLSFYAPVNQSWFYIAGELVNKATGATVPFDRTVEYWSGYDGGEYWSEGGTTNHVLISGLPSGQYYLNVDTESGSFKDVTPALFRVTANENVWTWSNWFWCLLLISIVPGCVYGMQRGVEVARWENSDYNPYRSSSS